MRESSVSLGIRMSPGERDLIKHRARSEGKSMSNYLRSLAGLGTAAHPKLKEHRLSGRELLELPRAEASRLLQRAAKLAAPDYESGGALRIFDADDPYIEL